MTKLKVLSDYSSNHGKYRAGQVIEVGPAEAQYLRADSPGSFAPVAEEQHKCVCGRVFDSERGLSLHQHYCDNFKALDNPPRDKMVRGATTK
jgi:hypothetical protein